VAILGFRQSSVLLIGALGSIETVGALQGVRTLLGPTSVVGVGIVSFAVPELSKRIDMSARAREKAAIALSAVVVGIGGAWGAIFLILPNSVGEALLGDTWPAVDEILLLSVLQFAGNTLPTGAACILYALGKTRLTFRLNLVLSPMMFGFPVIGLLIGDAAGAVVGYNLAFWIMVPVWWIMLRRVVREQDAIRARERAEQEGEQEKEPSWGGASGRARLTAGPDGASRDGVGMDGAGLDDGWSGAEAGEADLDAPATIAAGKGHVKVMAGSGKGHEGVGAGPGRRVPDTGRRGSRRDTGRHGGGRVDDGAR